MRSFHTTVWGLILFFILIMGSVVTVAFMRTSNATGHDPALISRQRHLAQK